ncbi:MAG: hypothetical protein V4683_11690 [Bacteroidota bacterium]
MKTNLLNYFFLIFSFLNFSINSNAQNIGIDQPIPQEKLDVNGNINLTGSIKANGASGTKGQVLIKGAGNTMAWDDIGGYKNFRQYSFTTDKAIQVWTAPANVTEVLVEIWAGGGGADLGGGGGGGGYAKVAYFIPASPQNTLNIVVGGGGIGRILSNDNDFPPASGGLSSVTSIYTTVSVQVLGGGAANGSSYGHGGGLGSVIGYNFISIKGEDGENISENGGNGGNSVNTGGKADKGAGSPTSYGHNGKDFGGGGGGNTGSGAAGKVIIYY